MDLLNISVDNGKYTIIQREDGSGEIFRYGEPWMSPLCNVEGSKMILAMAYELEKLHNDLHRKQEVIDEIAEEFYADEVDTAAIAGLLVPEAYDGHTVQLIVYSTPIFYT